MGERNLTLWRRAGLVALALAVGFAAGLALRARADRSSVTVARRPESVPGSVGTPAPDDDAAPAGPGPYSFLDGVGVGFERTEAGAVAAAVSYTTAAQAWLYLTEDAVREGAAAVVTPGAQDRLVGQLVDDVQLLQDQLRNARGTVWYVVAPLATRVDSYNADRAVVRVWSMRLLAADGVAMPQSGWTTLTLDLEWADGDWRVADVSEVDGPTPQIEAGLQPWAASAVDDALAGFVRVGAQ